VYYTWAKNQDDLDDLSFFEKPLVSASVGNIYIFTLTDTSVYTSGQYMPKYVDRCKNKEKITKWAISDESARQQIAIKSMNTKANKVDSLEDAFENVKRMSMRLNITERLALIAKLSEIILKA
jgi:hypothetical protein